MKPVILTALVISADEKLNKCMKDFEGNYEGKYNISPLRLLESFSDKPELAVDAAACIKLAVKYKVFNMPS